MASDEDDKSVAGSLSYLGALGWTFGVSGLTAAVVMLGAALRPGGGFDVGTLTLAVAAATLAIVLAMARVHAPEDSVTEMLGLRKVPVILPVLAFVAGVSLVFGISEIDAAIANKVPIDEETKAFLASDTQKQRIMLVLLTLVIPISQELFYRGAVFGLLERDKPRSMVVFVTTVLAVFPPSAHELVSGFLLAALASHLRGLSRSLWPALALRLGFAAVLVWATLTHHEDLKIPRLTQGLAAGATLICLGVFFVVSRGLTRRPT